MHIDNLDEVVKKYNNKYHWTTKMKPVKPVDVQSDSYTEYGVEHNDKDLSFKVSDYVRISKQKDTFANDFTPY